MAKKKRAGRPKGSKNKSKKRGRPMGWRKSITQSTSNTSIFSSQIQNLQSEKSKLLAKVKEIDKAISILKKLGV